MYGSFFEDNPTIGRMESEVKRGPTLDDSRLIAELRAMVRQYDESTHLAKVRDRQNKDPFKVLIATVLSQRTRDENTARASQSLFSKYTTVESLAKANVRDIEHRVKPSGFYHVKARRIKEIAQILLERYGGNVPDRMEELLNLPSVGRKTANCVLVYAFDKPAIPVDTHVHRVSNRLGIVHTKNPEETEEQLSHFLDKTYWVEINELMVEFGKRICRPIGPKCNICRLNRLCDYRRNRKTLKKRAVCESKQYHKRASGEA